MPKRNSGQKATGKTDNGQASDNGAADLLHFLGLDPDPEELDSIHSMKGDKLYKGGKLVGVLKP